MNDEMRSPEFTLSDAVLKGETADIYFDHTLSILRKENINPVAVMEVFPGRAGMLCGMEEVKTLLKTVLSRVECEVWALNEGDGMDAKEVVLRIKAPYQSYGLYETAIDGMLAQSSGWATAARKCVDAAAGLPVLSFGVRHVHPNVAAVMDYSAMVGGCSGCSSIAGASLAGVDPSGTMPHALILIMGDTVAATLAFNKHMDSSIPRISLVDTFLDENEESLRVAQALGEKLDSVRLDTPFELGGVTPELVEKVRKTLDTAGHKRVQIVISGGITPDRIKGFLKSGAPVDGFGVGSYISGAPPIDFTADLHEIDGKPVAKRGRTAGITGNPRLIRIM
ncbi:nicotinate phosphoribosyltransferase [Chloroflexota bacterium]